MSLFGYASLYGDEEKSQLQARLANNALVAGGELFSVVFEESNDSVQLFELLNSLKPGDALLLSKVYDLSRLSSDQFASIARVLIEKQISLAACDIVDSVISLRNDDIARYLTSQVLIDMIGHQAQSVSA